MSPQAVAAKSKNNFYLEKPIYTKAGENYLLPAEEKKLWSTLKRRAGKQSSRDWALLKTCRLVALRRGEAIALDVGDVSYNGATIKDQLVVDETIAKKGATGMVIIPRELNNILAAYLRQKRAWGESLELDAPLFVSRKGERMAPRTFNDLMEKWCREADIPIYTPHALRHTKAQRIMADYHLLRPEEQQKKLQFVAKQLRHKAFSSTVIYTAPTKEEMTRVAEV